MCECTVPFKWTQPYFKIYISAYFQLIGFISLSLALVINGAEIENRAINTTWKHLLEMWIEFRIKIIIINSLLLLTKMDKLKMLRCYSTKRKRTNRCTTLNSLLLCHSCCLCFSLLYFAIRFISLAIVCVCVYSKSKPFDGLFRERFERAEIMTYYIQWEMLPANKQK